MRSTPQKREVCRHGLPVSVLLLLAAMALPAPDSVAAEPGTAGTTTIHVIVVETHDRLTPTTIRGIIKRHEVDVTLKPDRQIQEVARQIDVSNASKIHQDPGSDRTTALGGEGRVVWHVLEANRLQRLAQNPSGQLLQVWTVETDAKRGCKVDVKFLLQQGQTETSGKIAGTSTPATFANHKVLQASCRIE